MRIEHVRLVNYKGFRDSGRITIGKKFTVLIGQNNAGKTAFLEAMSPETFENKPFRKAEGRPESLPQVLDPISSTTFGIAVTGPELKWQLLEIGNAFHMASSVTNAQEALPLVQSFFSSEYLQAQAKYSPNVWQTVSINFPLTDAAGSYIMVGRTSDRQDIQIQGSGGGPVESIVQALIGPYISSNLYVFRAERMNVGQCGIGGTSELRSDALNLASVLLQLQGKPLDLDRFTNYLRAVFPTIYSVVSRPVADSPSQARIEVINRDDQRSDCHPGVSIPLADSGTGISQVLAILYVAVTARTPRVIVIDEPNSFLHPGAAKKLVAILKEMDHQYIITTHSPEIIRTATPDVIHLVKWTGSESVVKTLDSDDVTDVRLALREVGASLSDVFGADSVLWVEGATEEICFPLLLRHGGHVLPAAINVVAMINTGDLESRRARRSLSWEVYERLSTRSALIPPALAFSFDREGRTATEIDDMLRRSGGKRISSRD